MSKLIKIPPRYKGVFSLKGRTKQPCSGSLVIVHIDDSDPEYANVSSKKQNRDGGEMNQDTRRNNKVQRPTVSLNKHPHSILLLFLLAPSSPSKTPLQNPAFHPKPGIFGITDYHQGFSVMLLMFQNATGRMD